MTKACALRHARATIVAIRVEPGRRADRTSATLRTAQLRIRSNKFNVLGADPILVPTPEKGFRGRSRP
jgi:hypothetical protein